MPRYTPGTVQIIPNRAIGDRSLPLGARWVLEILCQCAKGEYAKIKRETLMGRTGASKSTVTRWVSALVEKGYVIKEREQYSNVYRIIYDPETQCNDMRGVTDDTTQTPRGVTGDTSQTPRGVTGDTSQTPRGVTGDTQRCHGRHLSYNNMFHISNPYRNGEKREREKKKDEQNEVRRRLSVAQEMREEGSSKETIRNTIQRWNKAEPIETAEAQALDEWGELQRMVEASEGEAGTPKKTGQPEG